MAEQMPPQFSSHDDAETHNATYEISKQLPNENNIAIQMQTTKALFVAKSKSLTNAHLAQIYALKMGAEDMFCSS